MVYRAEMGPRALYYLSGISPQEGVGYVLQKELNGWRSKEEGEGYSYGTGLFFFF